MSNIKHTPEPWIVGASKVSILSNTDPVGYVANSATGVYNAARIVICVNEFAGKTNAEVVGYVAMMNNRIQMYEDKIESLRKELTGIREFINAHPDESTYDGVVRKVTQLEKAFDKINK